MATQAIHSARDTHWLGIHLAPALTRRENRRRCANRARQAEARIRRLMTKYGAPPASARNLPAAIAQGALMYAAELTWNGRGHGGRVTGGDQPHGASHI